MRRLFIAGNWKMNMKLDSAKALAKGLKNEAARVDEVDIAVCPPYLYVPAVAEILNGSNIGYGAQNVYFEKAGAFTGEIETAMLADFGCRYVILGHSERRHIMGESSELVNKKVHAVLAAGLTPIVCVGELLSEREAGVTNLVNRRQFDGSLSGVSADDMKKCVIAYEPVWAIGTGKVATPEQAQEVHADLRALMTERYGKEVADVVRIQYGGSVKADNAQELLSKPDIDGALVGGASLKVDAFMGIINACRSIKK
ncbi:MAG: triose-phosphate isomerase [Thermoguttaceae bacterium]|jgi:triosephosphate isomerase